jgi:hypothetical protein
MKKTNIFFAIPLLMGMILAGCQSNDKAHYRLIPADAAIICAMNLETFFDKLGVDNQLVSSLDPVLADCARNRKTLGIDFSDVFAVIDNNDFFQAAFVARVTDYAALEKYVKQLESDGKIESIEKKGENTVVNFNYSLSAVTFNKNVATFDDTEGYFSSKLLAMPEDQSILANETLVNALAGKEEFRAYFDLKTILSELLDFDLPEEAEEYADFDILLKASFPDGAVRFEASALYADPTVPPLVQISRPLTFKQLACIPESPMVLFAFNFIGEAYYNLMEKVIIDSPGIFQLNPFGNPFGNDAGAFLKIIGFLKSIDGDCTLGVIPGMPYPTLLLYADVKDNLPLIELNNAIQNLGPMIVNARTELAPDSYRLDLPLPGVSAYYGIKDGQFIVTNDEKLYSDAGKPVANSYKDSPRGKNIPKDAHVYVMFDIPAIVKPLSMLPGAMDIDPVGARLLSELHYIEIYSSLTEAVMQITLANPKANALKIIGDIAK